MTRQWPPYRTVRELVHAHVGRPAVVMGGGDSLLPTLDLIPDPARCVYLSANDHGARALRARARAGEVLAYVACMDKIEDRCRRELRKDGTWGAPWGVPLISRHMFGDYRILDNRFLLTGVACAWLARLMGCDPIYLAGMDNYVGGTYWDNPKAPSSGRYSQPREHLQKWATLFRRYPANYLAGGMELRKYLPGVDHVAPPNPVPPEQLHGEIAGQVVEVLQGTDITGRPFPPGVIEVKQAEADMLRKTGKGKLAGRAA